MINIIIEALDGKDITKRTGKVKCKAFIKKLPEEKDYLTVIYDESEKTESPGVFVAVDGLEIMGKEYKFVDDSKRPFMITVLE